ncbi:glycoside hydrolase family 43 protein [Niabella drilacis]|uniref:Glycosyl hydrolases family 43 n=1 Tax=Niabella drilacis (strain DSM 25811 / CCM 8410 / CCUG 62505 / LMG 26954 / E90) TaxID=1285928 RepID=A0A1G6TXP7_NIADE|nr:glycoside hydrolase family 43 protein [Niabella drilacis]SDD33870.1 Glycosyl hydrolases family 43 [Niabella drilacis]
MYRIFLMILIVSLYCASPLRAQTEDGQNPLMADPAIFFHNGVYYLYGTNGRGADNGFIAYTSTDLRSWKAAGKVLTPGDAFGTRGFWAPQVFMYKGRFYMAYTANEHIAIAVAGHPLGPFRQEKQVPLEGPVRMIDPFVFFDKGKIYLYHVRLREGNRIFVAEMDSELTAIKENTARECIYAEQGWENTEDAKWSVTEGPTVFKRGSLYYMLYSANDFRNPDYAIGVATSTSPLGPWTKDPANPVISKTTVGMNGTGHGDLFRDANGNWQYVLHTHFSGTKVGPRKTAIIQLLFSKKKNDPLVKAAPETFRFLNNIK